MRPTSRDDPYPGPADMPGVGVLRSGSVERWEWNRPPQCGVTKSLPVLVKGENPETGLQ